VEKEIVGGKPIKERVDTMWFAEKVHHLLVKVFQIKKVLTILRGTNDTLKV
jgi:hypothetical protein